MTAAIVVVLLLAALAVAYVVAPLMRADAAHAERVAHQLSEEMDLQSQHEMVLAGLKDLEEDHITDKIDEGDYIKIRDRLSARAVEIMKRMDELEAAHEKAKRRGPRPLSDSGTPA